MAESEARQRRGGGAAGAWVKQKNDSRVRCGGGAAVEAQRKRGGGEEIKEERLPRCRQKAQQGPRGGGRRCGCAVAEDQWLRCNRKMTAGVFAAEE